MPCHSWKDDFCNVLLKVPIFKSEAQYICEKMNIFDSGRGTFYVLYVRHQCSSFPISLSENTILLIKVASYLK